ncbi:putative ribonuclease H-like domain-containing protein, partial [Tanacetum coccineum]
MAASEEEADINNLETTISVNPIPITIIHKDHPKAQIIREVDSAVQTRRILICTDIAKITRKRSKPGKHGHGNGKSTQEPGVSSKETQSSPNHWIASLAIRVTQFDLTAKIKHPMIGRIQGTRSKATKERVKTQNLLSAPINRRLPHSLDHLLLKQDKDDNNAFRIFTPVNAATLSNIDYPIDPFMPDLEDTVNFKNTGIFENAYDDENMEPKKITQALDNESWVEAMQEEILQFKLLNTRRRSRLDEVFAPVARIEAIRLFLAYASYMDFTMYQMDVKSAFLYGTIEEEVYVCQPLGFVDPKFPNRVYKVEKALYGLHPALRAWYETLSTYLLENGFRRGIIDKTLFIKKIKNNILLVQVYVDDIIFGSTQKSLSTEFEQLMDKRFQMSSMGKLTFFLGLQVEQIKDGIFLSQDKYVYEILKKFSFSSVKTAKTPMETHKPLSKDENKTDVDVHLYRSMIGSLMYLTSSRPDIMFAVYLKGQPTLGLWYPKDSPLDLIAYSDSDYTGASIDRKSITGGCQFL